MGLLFLALTPTNAAEMKCGAGKCGASMQKASTSSTLSKMHSVASYGLELYSKKPLIVGNNNITIKLFKDGKEIDAMMKIRFFMPEMPGMPYMESKDRNILKEGKAKFTINLAMGGTWQYQVKFKTKDERVHKIKGSINL